MNKILKILDKLKIKAKKQWHRVTALNKRVDYVSFKHKRKEFVVSICENAWIDFCKKTKDYFISVYEGWSFEELESAIKREVGYERI